VAAAEDGQRLQALADADARSALGQDLQALALISLGSTEVWAASVEEVGRHLERGVALAQRIGRPYLEYTGRAHQATVQVYRSFARAAEFGRQAVDWANDTGGTTSHSLASPTCRSQPCSSGRAGWRRQNLGRARRANPQSRNRARNRTGDLRDVQLRAFQRAGDSLREAACRSAVLSVDDEVTTQALIEKHHLGFSVGHSANAQGVAWLVGAFLNEEPL